MCKRIMPEFNTSEWSNLGKEWGRKKREVSKLGV
jgi:hypothetical protein